jgi:hypothetical protein
MNYADEAIYAAIQQAQLLLKATRKKKTQQIVGPERDIVRATALSWFNNHRKQLTAVLTDGDLAKIDEKYQWVLHASHKNSLRSSYVTALKEIEDSLVELRSANVLELSQAPPAATVDVPPDFTSLVKDAQIKAILEGRWVEIGACITAKAPLAATVMMGGLLEGLLLARINSQTNKAPIYSAAAAPKDKDGKTLPLKEWTLQNYIGVAHELKWITQTVKDIGGVLRDYRNYIHPQKQYSEKVSLTPADANLLWEISKNIAGQVLTMPSTPYQR